MSLLFTIFSIIWSLLALNLSPDMNNVYFVMCGAAVGGWGINWIRDR